MGALIEGRCPTFSWGAVSGAKSYELVVYLLGEENEEAKPVLRQSIAGPAGLAAAGGDGVERKVGKHIRRAGFPGHGAGGDG